MDSNKRARKESFKDGLDYNIGEKTQEVAPSVVFKMFDEDFSPTEVVEETDADPIKVRDWYRVWLDMRGDWSKVKSEQLEGEARRRLADIKELLGPDAVRLQGKNPSGLIAAMIYMIAKEQGLNIAQTVLAEHYRVSEMTVRQNMKLLRKLFEEKGLNVVEQQEEV